MSEFWLRALLTLTGILLFSVICGVGHVPVWLSAPISFVGGALGGAWTGRAMR